MFSSRVEGLETSDIRKLFESAPAGSINMGIGEPDFQPPEHVRNAVKDAIDSGRNKYGPINGLPELREALSEKYRRYRMDLAKDNVIITAGGSEALMVTAMSFYSKGDEVLIPNPGFVFYEPHVRINDAWPVPYSLKQENGFGIDEEEIKQLVTRKTKAIVVNTPSNPCGGALEDREVKFLADIANDRKILVVSDEVYDEIVYDRPHATFMGKIDNLVLVNSFSKTYAMTGWRIGFLMTSTAFADKVSKIHYYTVACPSTPIQVGALAALRGPQDCVRSMVAKFRERRDFIVKALNEIPGFTCPKPKGAFYAFPSYDFELDDRELAYHLLKNKVICTPGKAFGPLGARHLRFSYANSLPNLKTGIELMREALKDQPRKGTSGGQAPPEKVEQGAYGP